MNPQKKYRLLKDLPDAKAGTIATLSKDGDSYDYKARWGEDCWYRKSYVEDNSEWWEELVEDEITVKVFYDGFAGEMMGVKLNNPTWVIPKEKLPLIKQAIENIVNDKEPPILGYNISQKDTSEFLKINNLFRQSDLDKARELAFNAARETYKSFPPDLIYPTFQDYLDSLKK